MASTYSSYKMLIVEDEDELRENYVMYFKTLFEEVYDACNGEKALELYKQMKPDIMVVDINLPKMNGLEVVSTIRKNDYNTKIIMLTAYTDKEFLLKASALKLTKYLVKPTKREDLKAALKQAIDELEKYKIVSIKKIELGDNLYWDCELKELFFFNKLIELTSREKAFMELLLSNKNKLFTYDEIFEHFWEEDNFTLNSLKNMVKRLRKKLPLDIIKNVFNQGYSISL